jgi:hypothetical protein
MAILELGEHLDACFHSQLLKTAVAMAAWLTAWQKTLSYVQTFFAF